MDKAAIAEISYARQLALWFRGGEIIRAGEFFNSRSNVPTAGITCLHRPGPNSVGFSVLPDHCSLRLRHMCVSFSFTDCLGNGSF